MSELEKTRSSKIGFPLKGLVYFYQKISSEEKKKILTWGFVALKNFKTLVKTWKEGLFLPTREVSWDGTGFKDPLFRVSAQVYFASQSPS